MAQFIYCNPDPSTQSRATQLGCGWVPAVPPQFQSIATAPCAIVSGAGHTVVLEEPTTPQDVANAAAPILSAEQAISQQEATRSSNRETILQRAANALSNNQNFLAIANPTTAQAVSQVKALTRQVDGLIRFLLNEFDSVADS